MDIYEYFNSRDVAEHCKKLDYNFTGRELAYMIWQSNHHTLAQKIVAWEEILQTMPDEIHEDFETGLHDFLRQYINRLQQFIAEFQADVADYAYSYEILYSDAPDRYLDESSLYTSYGVCHSAAMTESSENIMAFRIRKRKIYDHAEERTGSAVLYLNKNGEPVNVVVAPYYGEIDLLVEPFGYYGWYVDIPTPFQCGDCVSGIDWCGCRSGPMIVKKISEERGEDYLDMCPQLSPLDCSDYLRCYQDFSKLSLEHYCGNYVKQRGEK